MGDEENDLLDRRVNIDVKSALIGLLGGILMGPLTLSLLIRWFPALNFMEDMMVQQYCGEAMQALIIENVKTVSELQGRIEKLEFEICVLKAEGQVGDCTDD